MLVIPLLPSVKISNHSQRELYRRPTYKTLEEAITIITMDALLQAPCTQFKLPSATRFSGRGLSFSPKRCIWWPGKAAGCLGKCHHEWSPTDLLVDSSSVPVAKKMNNEDVRYLDGHMYSVAVGVDNPEFDMVLQRRSEKIIKALENLGAMLEPYPAKSPLHVLKEWRGMVKAWEGSHNEVDNDVNDASEGHQTDGLNEKEVYQALLRTGAVSLKHLPSFGIDPEDLSLIVPKYISCALDTSLLLYLIPQQGDADLHKKLETMRQIFNLHLDFTVAEFCFVEAMHVISQDRFPLKGIVHREAGRLSKKDMKNNNEIRRFVVHEFWKLLEACNFVQVERGMQSLHSIDELKWKYMLQTYDCKVYIESWGAQDLQLIFTEDGHHSQVLFGQREGKQRKLLLWNPLLPNHRVKLFTLNGLV